MATRTFLFVDQVASTEQLTRLGDHATRSIRRNLFVLLREASALCGGVEVDFTGDGLFCAFEGASEAVEAAVMMQQLVASSNQRQTEERRVAIRVGLNSGEPLAREDGGYFGTAVVVGSRLCGSAIAEQILVSEIVRFLVEPQGLKRFVPAGSFDLKGVPEPVVGYLVAWESDIRRAPFPVVLALAAPESDAEEKLGRVPELIGREEELRVAEQAWSAVEQGARRLLFLTGTSGAGVTRLAAELARVPGTGSATVLYGAALGRTSRLSPWSRALDDWLAEVSQPELRLAVGQDGTGLQRLVPGLHGLLPGLLQPEEVAPGAEIKEIATALDRLISRWSTREPVVLVLDRLDQADPESLQVLRHLMQSALPARLLIVVGSRSSQVGSPSVGAAIGQLPGVLTLALQGLSLADTNLLMAAVNGEGVEPESLRAVYAESAGVPSRVIQLAQALRERALTRRASEALGRVVELRSDMRAQRAEIADVVQQLEQLRYEDAGEYHKDDAAVDARSPYKGLAAYQPEDAEDFYGRELLVAELISKLASSRFLAVVGPSGSGKSSVVRAGLIPALARESVPGSSDWVPIISTPANESISAALQRGREQAHGQPIALFVDQFEELWTGGQPDSGQDSAAARAEALNLLIASIDDVSEQAVVVVSMRADYYGRTAEHPGLASLMSESQILVPPMTAAELQRAIEAPARRAGLSLEQGLVQAAISDIGDGAGRLPLLSTAMFETWQRRHGSALTLAGYAAAGGARRAIATLAETALASLSAEEQETARRIFLRLADPADDGGDVARAASLKELGDDESTRRVLNQLAARRLVSVSATTVQVAHEALLREWPRLREWLDVDREGRRLHHQVTSMTQEWEDSGRDSSTLARGVRLTAVSDWVQANPSDVTAHERMFLEASKDQQQAETVRRRRQLRRLQILALGLVCLLVIASVATAFGLAQAHEAGRRANEATASELSAQAVALAASNSDTALLLAVEGYRRDPSVNTEGGLLSALNGARFRTAPIMTLPKGITDTDLSPNRSTLYGMTTAGTIFTANTKTWALTNRRLVTGIVGPIGLVLSRSGNLLAYSGSDGLYVVNAHSGSRVAGPFTGGQVSGDFSFDDKFLLLTSYPAPGVRIVNLATGQTVTRDLGSDAPAIAASSPTKDEFVAGQLFGDSLSRYDFNGDLKGGAVKAPIPSIAGVTYSPNGSTIAVGGGDNTGVVVDSTTLKSSLPSFLVRGSRVYDEAYNSASDMVAVVSDDGSIEIINAKSGRSVHRISGLSGNEPAVVFLDDHRILATTLSEAVEFDLDQLTPLGRSVVATANSYPVWSLLSQTPSTVLASYPGSITRLSTTLNVRNDVVSVPLAGLTSAALSPNKSLLAVYNKKTDGTTQLQLLHLNGHAIATVALPMNHADQGETAFSPNGRYVAIRTDDAALTVVDVTSLRILFTDTNLDRLGGANALGWAPDNSSVYFGGQSGALNFIHPKTGQVTSSLRLSPSYDLDGIAMLPGGKLMAVSSESGFVYLVDTRTRHVVGDPLSAGGTQLQNVAVSPDGNRIVAISRDGALRIWDVASRRPLGPALAAHDTVARALTFVGSNRLITGDFSGGLVSWNLTPSNWVTTACRLVGRDLTAAEWHQYLPGQGYRKTCSDR